MTPAERAEIVARHERTTKGPWEAVRKSVRVAGASNEFGAPRGNDGTGICNTLGAGYGSGRHDPVNQQATANADFIAHAPQDIADLLQENARLTQRLAEGIAIEKATRNCRFERDELWSWATKMSALEREGGGQ
jgi:hypothetical protein